MIPDQLQQSDILGMDLDVQVNCVNEAAHKMTATKMQPTDQTLRGYNKKISRMLQP